MPKGEIPSLDLELAGYRTWSSEKVKEGAQFDYFADSIQSVFGASKLTQTVPGPFRMRIDQAKLGPLTLSRVQAQAHQADRNQSTAARDETGQVYINLPRVGFLNGLQASRRLSLAEGWIGMLDSAAAASVVADRDFEEYVIGIPSDLIKPRLADHIAAGITTGVLPAFLSEMTDFTFGHVSEFDTEDTRFIAQQMIDLAVASFGASTKSGQLRPAVILQAAMDEATRRLGDSDLTIDSLARHVNVSRRTLERLFADIGISPARWILDRRLQAARQELATRAFAD